MYSIKLVTLFDRRIKMSTRQGLRRSIRLQKSQLSDDQNEQGSSAPSFSLQASIAASSVPSPNVMIPHGLQLSQSDGSTATAPRRRKNAPVAVSSSPAKRQRRYYNLRSSSKKKSCPSPARVPAVTPKQISFESETEVYDIYSGPLVTQEDPSLVWASQHFAAYGATYLHHQRQKEERECKELFGTLGPYPPCAVVETYTTDAETWTYKDDEGAVEHEKYQYRQRILALKEVVPLDVSTRLPRQPMITAKMRAILVNWLVEVAGEYSVSTAAFHLGVSLLDAYLANGNMESHLFDEHGIVYRSEFQALGW